MPAAVSSSVRQTVENDDLDDIFNYDAGIDATFNQTDQDRSAQSEPTNNNANRDPDAQVNIDEEVKVTKKRKPVAKLDEERLLSQQGIPKLRKIAKDRIRINGKGHEFSDMARLLNTYQLWLDDLFPKAKFMDGVSMIEKLGHKKRIQMMRREWIEEGKPKPPRDDDDDDFVIPNEDAAPESQTNNNTEGRPTAESQTQRQEGQSSGGASGSNAAQPSNDDQIPDEDDLDALLAESENAPSASNSRPNNLPFNEEGPDEDELDALMAEDAQNNNIQKSLFGGPMPLASNAAQNPPDNFDDDEEAMAGMDW